LTALLSCHGLTRRFGGLTALDALELAAASAGLLESP